MRAKAASLIAGPCVAVLIARAAIAGPGMALELNRLEPLAGACGMHLVLENATPAVHADLQLDLVVFGPDGVVARRVTLDASPVRAHKTSVFAFDVGDLACSAFGRVLLNDITGCGVADCVTPMAVSSRSGVELVK